MIDPHLAFSLGNMIAMLGWLGLLLSLFVVQTRIVAWTFAAIAFPLLAGLAYALLFGQAMAAGGGGGFGSIEQVRTLFANNAALTAGWLHYLAFDLFVGCWIVREGLDAGVPRLLIIPCLILTFMVGPVGLLLFLVLRFAAARRVGLVQ